MSSSRDKFIRWIKAALPQLNEVRRVKQRLADTAVGTVPYAVIYFPSSQGTEYGQPTITTTDTPSESEPSKFIQTRERVQYGTLVVEIFDDDAHELIEALELSVSDPAIMLQLKTDDISIGATLNVMDTTELRDNSHARSVQAEFRVSWPAYAAAAVNVIETVIWPLST